VTTQSDTQATNSQTQNPYQAPPAGASYPSQQRAPRAGSSGLFIGSIICSVVALLFLPIVFGPVGAVLGFVDYGRGDKKGLWAGIAGIVATAIGMALGYAVYNANN
jgi:hypothetical protein